MRKLTKRFGSYALGKYEKATGKSVMDLLDVGNFEITRIANLIKLGNSDFKTEEEAYARLDEYLASDEDNSLISAYFDLIDELDRDVKVLKSCGISIAELKAQFNDVAGDLGNKMKDRVSDAKAKLDINEGDTESEADGGESDAHEENKVVDLTFGK